MSSPPSSAAPNSSTDGLLHGLTLHGILERFPSTAPVFDRLGIHTCCGGDVTLEVAAQRDGIPLQVLEDALRVALEGE